MDDFSSFKVSILPDKKRKFITIAVVVMVSACVLFLVYNIMFTFRESKKESIRYVNYTEPDIRTTSNAFMEEYSSNESDADLRYRDKHVLMTGKVNSIALDSFGNPTIEIRTDDKFANIKCLMSASEAGITNLTNDDDICIIGECKGIQAGIPLMVNCELCANH